MGNGIRRLLREPLFHFLALGALLFAAWSAMNGDDAGGGGDDRAAILITPERIARLEAGFEQVWKRRPDPSELEALIEADIREEVYYRDAVALGLDRGDALVRRRLRQKMEFIVDSAAAALVPAEGELEAFFAANRENYRQPPRIAFEQVYLGEDPAPETVAAVAARLRAAPDTDPLSLAVRSLLPAQMGLSAPDKVTGVFGKGFFDRVAALEQGVWAGPVRSAFGLHMVRLIDRLPAQVPPLAEIRRDVLRDWETAKRQEVRDADYARRRARYRIEIRRDAGSGGGKGSGDVNG